MNTQMLNSQAIQNGEFLKSKVIQNEYPNVKQSGYTEW